VQYDKPPVSFDGSAIGVPELDGFQVRLRAYDYGVVSIALSRGFAGDWRELVGLGQTLVENAELEQRAEDVVRQLVQGRLRSALLGARESFLSEDYLVYVVHELERPQTATALLATHGEAIAAMLRGERQRLSEQETTKILRHRISYLADDLFIPTWNAAFVYDTPAAPRRRSRSSSSRTRSSSSSATTTKLLDRELASIYALLQHPKWYDEWVGSRYRAPRASARALHRRQRADRSHRKHAQVHRRHLRLAALRARRQPARPRHLEANVHEKLKTLDDVYRFAVELSTISRGQFMELAIVLILVLELVLFFVGGDEVTRNLHGCNSVDASRFDRRGIVTA
jgi:hypothetical protein